MNAEDAYYHFRVATLQGGKTAGSMAANDLKVLSAKLGAEKVQVLDRKASEWYQNHHLSLEFVYKAGQKDFPSYALLSPENDAHVGRLITTSQF